jgi:hypothetical protein
MTGATRDPAVPAVARRRRFSDKLFDRIGAPLAAWLVRMLARTLKLELKGGEHYDAAMRSERPVLFVFWHEDLFGSTVLHLSRNWRRAGGKRLAVMVSHSRDGQKLAGVIGRLGMEPIRGSSSRGGLRGLIEMERWLKTGEGRARFASVAPDGPRGPRRVAKPGAALLARRTQALVLPVAYRFSSQWTFKSWDRMKLAKPFARVEGRIGELIDPLDYAHDEQAIAQAIGEALRRIAVGD